MALAGKNKEWARKAMRCTCRPRRTLGRLTVCNGLAFELVKLPANIDLTPLGLAHVHFEI